MTKHYDVQDLCRDGEIAVGSVPPKRMINQMIYRRRDHAQWQPSLTSEANLGLWPIATKVSN